MPSSTDLRAEVTVHAEVAIPASVSDRAISSLIHHVLVSEGMSGAWQFGIRFVDDARMQDAHAEFMGIDEPTDIMTFPYQDDGFDLISEDGEELVERGGDFMISVDRAEEHAREAGWELDQELLFLICHGVLHVLGWEDAGHEQRAAMLERQSNLLRSWEDA